ncbi:hypothetical protein ACFQ71_41055 [Streptomyces sp. NPDC056534]
MRLLTDDELDQDPGAAAVLQSFGQQLLDTIACIPRQRKAS